MLQFHGRSALSPFRLERLLHSIQVTVPQVAGIRADYHYFCQLRRDLTVEESDRLQQLLDAATTESPAPNSKLLLVVPRPGTISPWSSKATDIAHNCGLDGIERLERGIGFALRYQTVPSAEQLLQIEACLHDRMTEVVLPTLEAAAVLFQQATPGSWVKLMWLARNGCAGASQSSHGAGAVC